MCVAFAYTSGPSSVLLPDYVRRKVVSHVAVRGAAAENSFSPRSRISGNIVCTETCPPLPILPTAVFVIGTYHQVASAEEKKEEEAEMQTRSVTATTTPSDPAAQHPFHLQRAMERVSVVVLEVVWAAARAGAAAK